MSESNIPAITVDNVSKSFADKIAVRDLSFSVNCGEIFGLIGPNGAGKTTTIRMIMDIFKPDSGSITVLGKKLSDISKRDLGYLPEERGLYKKMRVIDTIVYLASLKGMDKSSAEAAATKLLVQTGMQAARNKKVEELSKGMGQLIQFIVTVIHDPDLLVLDEPFTGLDPVNTDLLISMIMELRNRKKTIIFSTHQMNQVEELCDRVLMIDHGQNVLYGNLKEIKTKYRGNTVLLDFVGDLRSAEGTSVKHLGTGTAELELSPGTTPAMVLMELLRSGVTINRFEVATPSLHEIFLEVAGKRHE